MSRHRPDEALDGFPDADLSGIPLPPAAPDELAGAAPAAARPARPPAQVAALEFLEPAALIREVALDHPFRWQDRDVRSVTVRRLAAGEVGLVVDGKGPDDLIELYDFMEVMTGLPKAVLRGMIDADNERVAEACRPFLPRLAVLMFSTLIGEPGDATSSSPAAG